MYFNFSHSEEENNRVASSFLRLYKLEQNGTENANGKNNSCNQMEDKLLRVSVHWYMKPLRKNVKNKKKLADSKMFSLNSKWVELSIRPALSFWAQGRKNFGLSITIEDQENNMLKTTDFFKGPSCMVGMCECVKFFY